MHVMRWAMPGVERTLSPAARVSITTTSISGVRAAQARAESGELRSRTEHVEPVRQATASKCGGRPHVETAEVPRRLAGPRIEHVSDPLSIHGHPALALAAHRERAGGDPHARDRARTGARIGELDRDRITSACDQPLASEIEPRLAA